MIKNFNKQVDSIINIMELINLNEVTVLTGDNGTGKSLIRKLIWNRVRNQLGYLPYDVRNKSLTCDISMERRTSWRSSIINSIERDYSDSPTSMETFRFLREILRSMRDSNNSTIRYVVLDEPEIGASREVQKAFAKYINQFYEEAHNFLKSYGLLIITHSETLVENLKYDKFINIQGLNKDEWINRKLVDIDLEKLEEDSNDFRIFLEGKLKC